jgi:hypothetical protein
MKIFAGGVLGWLCFTCSGLRSDTLRGKIIIARPSDAVS